MNKTYIAPLNLSKLGFRYFRMVLESKAFSRKFIRYVVSHPNTGYVFQGTGWSGKKKVLGIGMWATNNAEMIDLSHHLRAHMSPSYNVVYQSELTRLEFFAPMHGVRTRMVLIDELENKLSLTATELNYLRLISADGSLGDETVGEMLHLSHTDVRGMRENLKNCGVYYGILENTQLPPGYTKFFVDTAALPADVVSDAMERLASDPHCVYLARGNGKYNFEFEYTVTDETSFNAQYASILERSKRVRFDDNIFTNLFPQSKFSNTKKIVDTFTTLARTSMRYFDLRNSELWYMSIRGAQAYLDVYSNPKYAQTMNTGEVELFEEVVHALDSSDTTYNLIDLGSGDGEKAKRLIECMGERRVKAYFPVDIQEVELAHTLHTHRTAPYSIHPTMLGFENLSARFPIATNGRELNVYALFGGTYGNFPQTKINTYLKPILENDKDILIVSMPIREHMADDEILDSYRSIYIENMAFGPLESVGIQKDDCMRNPTDPNLILQLRMEENRVISSFTLAKSVRVHGFTLESGTRFDITTSWKPSKQEFTDALSADFSVRHVSVNTSSAVAVCGKK